MGVKKFFKWVGIGLVATIVVGWLYVQWKYPDYSVRYRLSLEVETPAGVKTGSGVLEASEKTHIRILPQDGGYSSYIRGESVVVEVSAGQYLFVLLKRDKAENREHSQGPISLAYFDLDIDAYKQVSGGARKVRFIWDHARYKKGKREVPPANLPLLVTFTDINDPSSVKRVEPDDLESHFGAGVKLKAITLEITGEKVTKGRVEKVLGWLESHRGRIKSIGNKKFESELLEVEKLYTLHFRTKS